MALVNNATTIGTGGQNLVLETAGHIYVKVNERYYELDFKNSGSEKLYGKPIVNEVVQPTEEVDLSDYITNDDLKKALKKYVTEKSWQDVMDTQSALQNSLLDFEEAIKPITVQTMQVVVGSEELQFDWIFDFAHTKGPNNSFVDSPLYIDMDESSTHYNQLVWNPGYIKHYTFDGPKIVRPEDSLGSSYSDDQLKKYWRWYIKNSEGIDGIEEINMDGTFYVYLKVPHSSVYNKEGLDSLKSLDSSESSESSNNSDTVGGGPHGANLYLDENGMPPQQLVGTGIYAKTGIGQVVYSSEAIKFGPEYDETTRLNYYYLLYAIVTNSDGSPSISTLNGFTEILPGQIRAYIFATPAGDQYLDFLHGKFRIGGTGEYLEWDGEKLNIKGSISVTGGELKTELEKFQSPTDNEIECWFPVGIDGVNKHDLPLPNATNKEAIPNWPVSTWGNNLAEHLGDFYYVLEDNPNTTNINEKDWAYRYIKKDDKYYWDKVSDHSISKELYKVYQAKETADQALNKFSDWAADGVISPLEVNDIKTEYNFIVKDYEEQSYKATTLNLKETTEWTNYNTAYNNYKTSLEKVFTWWNGIKSDPNTRTGIYPIPNDFQTNLEAYYSARSTFINLAFKNSTADVSYITAAIKKGKTDITGGLIMTGLIELGFGLAKPDDANYYDSFRVTSGINGICEKKDANGNYSDPAVWFGGNNLDLENDNDINKSEAYSLFIKKSENTYTKYIKEGSTVQRTLYRWIKNNNNSSYGYSLGADGYNLVQGLDSEIPLLPVTLGTGGMQEPYTHLLQTTLTTQEFTDSFGNQQIINGTIEAYKIQSITTPQVVYNIETQSQETLSGTFDTYVVKQTESNLIISGGRVITTYIPKNSTSINGFIININGKLHYIKYSNLKPRIEKGFLYRLGSGQTMVIDVYKYNSSKTFYLYKWKNKNEYIYTLTDYTDEPKYVYSYSNDKITYLSNYTVIDYSNNLAKAMFRMNGSGYLANGNISWDTDGFITMNKISVESGNIGPLVVSSDKENNISSVKVMSGDSTILDINNNSVHITGTLETHSSWYDNAAIKVSDPLSVSMFSVSAQSLSTDNIPIYIRRAASASLIYGKGSIMGGTVTIPDNAYYSILEPQYLPSAATYTITNFELTYDIAKVKVPIKGHICAIPIDNTGGLLISYTKILFSWTWDDGDYKGTYTLNDLTIKNFIFTGTSGYADKKWGIYLYLEPDGQVKSGLASNSWISIYATTNNEAKITFEKDANPIPGTFIGSNGISSIFGKNTKFQWVVPSVMNDIDSRKEGGQFIVEIPSNKDRSEEVGIRINGFKGANGVEQTPGIQINTGNGWHTINVTSNGITVTD